MAAAPVPEGLCGRPDPGPDPRKDNAMRGQILIGAALLVAAQGTPVSAQDVAASGGSILDRPIDLHGGVCGIVDSPGSRGSWVDMLWPGGVVPYTFAADISAGERAGFVQGLNSVATACGVRFIERTSESDYILVTRSPDAGVSYSSVGRVGGAQQIQIANTHWNWNDLVAHELMHALGLWHEQQRPDRDDYILVNSANISPGTAGNFNYAGQAHGPYDFESVMHYSACAFSTCSPCSAFDAGCRTMTALPPYESMQGVMGAWNGLSDGDKSVLTMMYGPALRPVNDNRSGDVLVQIGNADAIGDAYSPNPAGLFEPIARTLFVSDSQGLDETGTASVVTRSSYGGYDESTARFETIEFVTQIKASLQVGFESGQVIANEQVSMGFEIDHLDPGEMVELTFAASVRTDAEIQGAVETAYVRLTGPGVNILVDTEYNHTLRLGNGAYNILGAGRIELETSFGDFVGEASVELTASIGRPDDVALPQVLAGPFQRNDSAYYLLENATWERSQLLSASCFGGDLVTVDDAAENSWIRSNVTEFDGMPRHAWIGYSDRFEEGAYAWASGDLPSYEAWLSGEPNGSTVQNYGAIFRGSSGWFDAQNDWNEQFSPVHGIVEVEIPSAIAGPFHYNGNTYYLLDDADWNRSRAAALAMGGDLVTIDDASEGAWIRSNVAQFDGEQRHTWIGLSDKGHEGEFTWVDGSSSTYRPWISGEPNGGFSENAVAMWMGSTAWFDAQHDWNERFAPIYGVAEIPGVPPCSSADLSEPFGTLDFSDVISFLSAFGSMDSSADLAAPFGVFDFSDVVQFLTSFGAGCP